MAPAPCGCELIRKSFDESDPRLRESQRHTGVRWQRAWGCPDADPRDVAALPPPSGKESKAIAGDVALVSKAVQRCCNLAEAPSTCPLRLAKSPEARAVVQWHRWWKTGQFKTLVPNPTGVQIDALNLLEDSLAVREAWQLEQLEKERSKQPPDKGDNRPPR